LLSGTASMDRYRMLAYVSGKDLCVHRVVEAVGDPGRLDVHRVDVVDRASIGWHELSQPLNQRCAKVSHVYGGIQTEQELRQRLDVPVIEVVASDQPTLSSELSVMTSSTRHPDGPERS